MIIAFPVRERGNSNGKSLRHFPLRCIFFFPQIFDSFAKCTHTKIISKKYRKTIDKSKCDSLSNCDISPNRARELEAGEETFFCEEGAERLPRPTAKGNKSGTESQAEPRKIRPPLKRQVHKSRGNGFHDRKRELLHGGGCKGFRFRFFLLMKPCGLWQACLAEGGKEIEISVKLRRWCRKKRCSKMRSSHKYIFYFYPTWRKNERGEIEEIKGSFRFFERVKDGKAAAARMGRKYDHQKIF